MRFDGGTGDRIDHGIDLVGLSQDRTVANCAGW
jgi:hypothetical protein